jgi:alpha-D-ribose 1-methylphosphonate 5-triphosphate synthase subunit PhnL
MDENWKIMHLGWAVRKTEKLIQGTFSGNDRVRVEIARPFLH